MRARISGTSLHPTAAARTNREEMDKTPQPKAAHRIKSFLLINLILDVILLLASEKSPRVIHENAPDLLIRNSGGFHLWN